MSGAVLKIHPGTEVGGKHKFAKRLKLPRLATLERLEELYRFPR